MRSYRIADQFLRDFRALEPGLSEADAEILDQALAAILADPEAPRRFPSFYHPLHPSWLIRNDPFLVHYSFDAEEDDIVFLNVFRRR